MPEIFSAQNDDYQRRKALESSLADLIERVKRLEAARPPPQVSAAQPGTGRGCRWGEAADTGDVAAPGERAALQQDRQIRVLQTILR